MAWQRCFQRWPSSDGMHPVGQNNPCYEVTIVKRRLQEIFVSGKPHLYFSDSVWKEL